MGMNGDGPITSAILAPFKLVCGVYREERIERERRDRQELIRALNRIDSSKASAK